MAGKKMSGLSDMAAVPDPEFDKNHSKKFLETSDPVLAWTIPRSKTIHNWPFLAAFAKEVMERVGVLAPPPPPRIRPCLVELAAVGAGLAGPVPPHQPLHGDRQ